MLKKKNKRPWPTKEAMEQVYAQNLWGSNADDFYSGEGSHNPTIVVPYVNVVTSFLKSFKQRLTVCDFGCGDFNVGKQLVNYAASYVAVDIVPSLIAHNKATFKADNLTFQCLNIAEDEMPTCDCALIRQVFQHLSNAEIQNALEKLKEFTYLIITEHVPTGNFEPNVDIISGQGTRLKKDSGVDVLAPPFSLSVIQQKELLVINLAGNRGRIVTTLYAL